jgi:hypothetical protein
MTQGATKLTGEARFTYDGAEYRLVMGNRAIIDFELTLGISIATAMAELSPALPGEQPKPPPRLTLVAGLIKAGLAKYHPQLTLEDAMDMAADPAVQKALQVSSAASAPEPMPQESTSPLA